MKIVRQCDRGAAVATVAELLHNFLNMSSRRWISRAYNLQHDVPYVAFIMVDSIYPINPDGFWQFRAISDAFATVSKLDINRYTWWQAKHLADQILLLFGTNQDYVSRWIGSEYHKVIVLTNTGSRLYSRASQEAPAGNDDLDRMAHNFNTWVEVIPEFYKNRPLVSI